MDDLAGEVLSACCDTLLRGARIVGCNHRADIQPVYPEPGGKEVHIFGVVAVYFANSNPSFSAYQKAAYYVPP